MAGRSQNISSGCRGAARLRALRTFIRVGERVPPTEAVRITWLSPYMSVKTAPNSLFTQCYFKACYVYYFLSAPLTNNKDK